MPEYVAIALWRRAGVALEQCHADLLSGWATEALAAETLNGLTVSLALADQGIYARRPDSHGLTSNADAFVLLDLARAHDLDDVPARDGLHAVARRVEVWRVDTTTPRQWDRTWSDGEEAPGLKMVSFMRRVEGLTHEQFVRHWREQHTPLALEHHPGLWNYRQHAVRRCFTPGGESVDGIAELHFRSRDDFDHRFFDSGAGPGR